MWNREIERKLDKILGDLEGIKHALAILLIRTKNLPRQISLAAKFTSGVIKMSNNLAEKVGVADVMTVTATSSDPTVTPNPTLDATSDNAAVLTVAKNPDGTFALNSVSAGTSNLSVTGTDPSGLQVLPLAFVVTVSAQGVITLSAKFAVGVVS